MDKEFFLIDSDSLIEPHNKYYSFDFAPSFWRQMETHIQSGTIAILDLVKSEVPKGNDDLTSWLRNIRIGEVKNCSLAKGTV